MRPTAISVPSGLKAGDEIDDDKREKTRYAGRRRAP